MRTKILIGLLAGFLLMPAAIMAQQATLVIQQNEVPVYDASTVDTFIASLQAQIDDLQAQIATVATLPIEQSDVNGLETRLAEIEADVATNFGLIGDLEGDVTAILADLETRVLQASASANALWAGTQAEYDAIATKDPSTVYVVIP